MSNVPRSDALISPAAARNRGPILAVLKPRLPNSGIVLEIGAGPGEHAPPAHAASLAPARRSAPGRTRRDDLGRLADVEAMTLPAEAGLDAKGIVTKAFEALGQNVRGEAVKLA